VRTQRVQHDYTRLYECFRALVDAVDTDSAQMQSNTDRQSLIDDDERNPIGQCDCAITVHFG